MDKEYKIIFSLLKQSRYLQHAGDEKITKLVNISSFQTANKGETLLRQGEKNEEVYLIVRGVISVYVDGEYIYNLGRIGDLFGEMSVITGAPSSATIRADEDLQMIKVSSSILKEIQTDKDHELHAILYEWFSHILSDKLHKTSQKAKLFEAVNAKLQDDLSDAKLTQNMIFSACTHEIQNLPLTLKSEFCNTLGGDLYAVLAIDATHYGILIGDVAGHGTGACLISMMILNLFQTFSTGIHSPEIVINYINNMSMKSMVEGKFATIFYGVYDTELKKITYTSAGHPPCLLLRGNDVITLPATGGMAIGVLDSEFANYSEKSFTLEDGDRLILYTDAVLECLPYEEGTSKLERVIDYIRMNCRLPSREFIEQTYRDTVSSVPEINRDDFTMMIFEQK
ncbi:MAG: SpoIIE family protein phosphatase [SAR324 cluster bacterium]|nr:SpoIIE family protein phosphatase [SAR324 cluster bacterium]